MFIDTAVNTAWGVALGLLILFVVDAVCYSVCTSYRLYTGRYLFDDLTKVVLAAPSRLKWSLYEAYTWGVANPTWYWDLCDRAESLFAKGTSSSPRYFE